MSERPLGTAPPHQLPGYGWDCRLRLRTRQQDRLDRDLGWETIETCEPATSAIVAPARSAMLRCVAGGMTRSSVPTTAQLGSDFQAPSPEGVVFALNVIGRWLSTINHRSASSRSWAK